MMSIETSKFLAVAVINRPQGRSGEVIAELATDFPDRFDTLRDIYLGQDGQSPSRAILEHSWKHKGRIVLKFAGVDTIAEASRLRGCEVLVRFEERVPLPENSYYWSELVGCRVVAGEQSFGREIGTVTAVEPTGGVDLLHVARNDGGNDELLLPFARAICKRIDTENRTIEIDPPEDLLNLNDGAA
jgi:16S rRNA processing protein RimM